MRSAIDSQAKPSWRVAGRTRAGGLRGVPPVNSRRDGTQRPQGATTAVGRQGLETGAIAEPAPSGVPDEGAASDCQRGGAHELPRATRPVLPNQSRQRVEADSGSYLKRKEAQVWSDQLLALEQLSMDLQQRRDAAGEAKERITKNTLIRVAIDYLLENQKRLSGASEAGLAASLGLPRQSTRPPAVRELGEE